MPEAIQVIERTGLAHVNLRGDPGDGAFVAAVRGVLGADLPLAANTTVEAGGNVACWLGPDEWLVIADGDGAALARALRSALGGIFSAVTEVGGGNVAFVLRGEGVRELLARECPLDLDVLRSGHCAQTRLAKAAILLRPLDDGAIELVTRRSFSGYLRLWLHEAGANLSATPPMTSKEIP